MQINQLPAAASLNLLDKFAVDATDGVTKSITAQALRDLIRTNSYGAPLEASTVTAMTDTSKVYVYTGNETGYTNGNWYYYNGTAWVSGGAYNSVAVTTDKTLSLSNVAADAKAVGDAIAAADTALSTAIAGVQTDVDKIFSDTATAYENLEWPVSTGQYCLYAGFVYKANQDIPTIESWNPYHWTQTNLGEGLSNLSDVHGDIDDLQGAIVTERLARQTADNTLTGSINTEVAAREAADTALSSAISAEATAREQAIAAEASAREVADDELTSEISTAGSAQPVDITDDMTIVGGLLPTGADADSGSFAPYRRSGYIPVIAGWTLQYTNLIASLSSAIICVYDTDKTLKSSVAGTSNFQSGEIEIVENGYIRLSANMDYTDDNTSVKIINPITRALDMLNSAQPVNLTDKLTVAGGLYPDGSDGNTSSFVSGYKRTEYIPVMAGWVLRYSGFYGGSGVAVAAVYDSKKAYVTHIQGNGGSSPISGEITINQDGYVRFSTHIDNINSADFSVLNNVAQGFAYAEKDINLGSLTDNAFIRRDTGEVSTDTTVACASDFVPVIGSYLIEFDHVRMTGNACVAQYRADKSFISALYPEATTISSFRVVLHADARYIRVTGRKSPYPAPTARYVDYAADVTKQYTYVEDEIAPVIVGTGYLISNGKTVTPSEVISYTDYIPVEPLTTVTVTKMFPETNTGIFMFDENKNIQGRVRALQRNSTVGEITIPIPVNTHYIRYNVTTANASSTRVKRVATVNDAVIKRFVYNLFGQTSPHGPFARQKASHGPLFTIIDDDALSQYQVETLCNLCEYMGMRGTLAVITSRLAAVSGLKDLLLSYEDKGHHMVTHCYEQVEYMRGNTAEDIANMYSNMTRAKREMREAGFVNYNFWATPYGRHDAVAKKLAKDLGFECLISGIQPVFINYTPYEDKWGIPRMELYPEDAGHTQTLADIKAQIDQCVPANGWLIVTTHMYQWAEEPITTGYTRFKEMVQYALDAGMTPCTFAEGYEIWKPVYTLQEMLG